MTDVEVILVVVAAAVAALIKSIAGFGYPLTLVPILVVFLDVADAVAIVSLSSVALNLTLLYDVRHRRNEMGALQYFVPFAIVGAIAGTMALSALPSRLLRLTLVLLIAAFLVTSWKRPKIQLSNSVAKQLGPVVGLLGGVLYGATAVAGPIVSMWFYSLRISRDAFVFGVTTVFAVSGTTQIAILASRGMYTGQPLYLGLGLIPLVLLLVPIGLKIRSRVSMPSFQRFIRFLLAGSAASMLVRLL